VSAVVDVEQTRGAGLGASQAAQALGLCPASWGAPIDLWLELTGRKERTVAGQAARWGQILEPVVRGVYTEQHHCPVLVPQTSLYHRTLSWLRATPDGVALDADEHWHHLVQVKCPGLRAAPHWGVEERREVPVYYHVQAAVEMSVTRLPRVDFAVLLGGQEYFEVPVYHDEELEHDVLEGLAAFWRCVETDQPPPVDASEGYGRYLATLVETKERKAIEASEEIATMIARWREVRQAQAQLEAEEGLIKNRLLAHAVSERARQIRSPHGTVPIVESPHTHTRWKPLATDYAYRLGLDEATLEADIERYTTRSGRAFPRAPAAWSKE
jgi:putative phage-type endonuclease